MGVARQYYHQAKSRFEQGRVLLIELTDALTQALSNEIAYRQAPTDVLSKEAGQRLATLDQTEIKAQLTQSLTEFDKTTRGYNRVLALFGDSTATPEELEHPKARQEQAQQTLTVVRFNQQPATIHANQSGRVIRQWAGEGELVGSHTIPGNIRSTNAGGLGAVGFFLPSPVRTRPAVVNAGTVRAGQ